jgi:hypothetical protein
MKNLKRNKGKKQKELSKIWVSNGNGELWGHRKALTDMQRNMTPGTRNINLNMNPSFLL